MEVGERLGRRGGRGNCVLGCEMMTLTLPLASLLCPLEKEEGCREEGEVNMLCIISQ